MDKVYNQLPTGLREKAGGSCLQDWIVMRLNTDKTCKKSMSFPYKEHIVRHLISLLFFSLAFLLLSYCNKKKDYTFEEYFNRFDMDGFITAIPQLAPLELKGGKTIEVQAKNCGACHVKIYNEWKQATHATALQDIQYQAELTKVTSPKWVCLNCHIPVQNQREYIINKNTKIHIEDKNDLSHITKVKNPGFDPEMQKESVTCATCHIRSDENGKSYVVGSYDTEFAAHPVKKDREYLRNICFRCHSPGFEQLTDYFQCWFKTKEEMDDNPASGSKDCVDCHMPVEKRKATIVDERVPERDGHKHHWVGGGVPKWYSAYDTLIDRGYESSLKLDVKSVDVKSGRVKISVNYENSDSGHLLPTGDPERHIQIRASVMASGKELAFQKIRIGQEWDWGDPSTGRPAKKLDDNRMKPFEKRSWDVELEIPASVKKDPSSAKIVIQAIHVRLKSNSAKFMMEAKGVDETYLPDGQNLVKNAIHHYPMASFIYRQDFALDSEDKKLYSLEELIELSKAEKGKPLQDRLY